MNGEDLKKIVSFTGFGFASGLPYVLVFITLTAWLRDVDIDLSLIGFFGWITLTYSLKFLWAPFVDRFSIPLFDFYGPRRSWILLMQIIIFVSLILISKIDPEINLLIFAIVALIIAFAGSIQDIAIDALRIESAKLEDQGNLAAGYQFGYRVSILVGSSFSLLIADAYSWSAAYQLMALIIVINLICSFLISTEERNEKLVELNHINSIVEPIKDFFERFGIKLASILLLIVATYRLTDIVMGPMANPFYIDTGYSLTEIGYVKIIALVATIVGVFVGGVLIKQMGLYKSLMIGAVLVMFTNLLFSFAAINDKNMFLLSSIVASDSITAGIVGTVNITFLTSLVSPKYTGFQYALFTSLMAFLGKTFSGFSGIFVENFQEIFGFSYGWMGFYIFTSLLAIPAILLIYVNRNFFINKDAVT
jgi:PAT family beta-lactamase induction signal transducer AmpG|tara:strand:- start:504 stop:1766 length:1263 start_codon:yes stop_codon:yes gene_type:complete